MHLVYFIIMYNYKPGLLHSKALQKYKIDRHIRSEMGQLTLASGGLCRNWPDSGNRIISEMGVLSFGKSPPIMPGLPHRTVQEILSCSSFPQAQDYIYCSTSKDLSDLPSTLLFCFAEKAAYAPRPGELAALLLTVPSTLNQVVLQSLTGVGFQITQAFFPQI